MCDGHSPTDTSAHSGVTVMQQPWPLAKVNGFIPMWESLIFNWHYLSSPPQILRASRCPLESRGLKCVTVSILKRSRNGRFASEPATWIHKWFKMPVGTSTKL
jgi:hypothetical protein